MTTLLIVAIVVILILVFLMFIILQGTVKQINSQTKLYFVDKLQEYDYLINQKEEKLDKINKELKEKELTKEDNDFGNKGKTYEFDYNIIDLFNKTEYQDKNFFELSKSIDEKFNIDYVSLIKEFLKNIKEDNTYSFCQNFRNKFTSDVIYELKIKTPEEQMEFLKNNLNDNEYQIYKLYINLNEKNDIDGFLDYLNELIDLNNPMILVYVGKEEENYDYLSKYIKTIYSKDIYKGIKIIYRNKIYDYSLNERNV